MSEYYSVLFVWSKGASTRKRIFKILAAENSRGNPVYISKLTKLYNASLELNEHQLTNSSIRKIIKVLKNYDLIKPLNEGGRPEYLELTEQGKKMLGRLSLKSKNIPLIEEL